MIISIEEAYNRIKNNSEAEWHLSDKGVPVLRSSLLQKFDCISHGFSTRLGGVSKGIYADMSVGLLIGDNRDDVYKNYELLGDAIGFDWQKISSPHQIHETYIRRVDEEDAGSGIVNPLRREGVDGQITDTPGLPLIVYGADCVPMLFMDPVLKVIGTAHGGWRGTVQGIAPKMIKKFVTDFGSNPDDIYVVIGPSAGDCCYEVDDKVATEFIKIDDGLAVSKGNGKYMVDLWNANKLLLMREGVREDHISVMGICTICNSDMFHSHRATGGKRGLNCGIIMLTE